MYNDKDELMIGHKINIGRGSSKTKKTYPSQILDILDDDIFVVSGPMYKRGVVLLHKGEIIEVSYMVENKGKYYFKAKVLERCDKRIYKIKLKKVSDIKRVQLRNYYRFDLDLPVEKDFAIEIDGKKEVITENCRTKNISGGGLKLYSNFHHRIGDRVVCSFYINNHKIVIKGEVVRIEEVDVFYYKYGLGIKFIGLKEKDRDRIIRFIFQKERELKKKGLI